MKQIKIITIKDIFYSYLIIFGEKFDKIHMDYFIENSTSQNFKCYDSIINIMRIQYKTLYGYQNLLIKILGR